MQLIEIARTKPIPVEAVAFAVSVFPVNANPDPITTLAKPPAPLPESIDVPDVAGAKLPVDVGA